MKPQLYTCHVCRDISLGTPGEVCEKCVKVGMTLHPESGDAPSVSKTSPKIDTPEKHVDAPDMRGKPGNPDTSGERVHETEKSGRMSPVDAAIIIARYFSKLRRELAPAENAENAAAMNIMRGYDGDATHGIAHNSMKVLAAEVRRLRAELAHAVSEGVKIGEERNIAVKALETVDHAIRMGAGPSSCKNTVCDALAAIRKGAGAVRA